MHSQFSKQTQELLDRAQRAIDDAFEIRAARQRAAEQYRQRSREHNLFWGYEGDLNSKELQSAK